MTREIEGRNTMIYALYENGLSISENAKHVGIKNAGNIFKIIFRANQEFNKNRINHLDIKLTREGYVCTDVVFDKKTDNLPIEKPPLGIMTKQVYDEIRFEDLCGAISRYLTRGLEIPLEWIEEYNGLVVKLK